MFGELKNIYLVDIEPVHSIITFKDYYAAYICQQSLNNFILRQQNVTLLVKWVRL